MGNLYLSDLCERSHAAKTKMCLEFINIINNSFLTQIVWHSTLENSALDLILTDEEELT